MLHIIPASYDDLTEALAYSGNKVLMKSGKSIGKTKALLAGKHAMAVECCGMENEKIHRDLTDLDENSSYFSVLVIKEEKQ
jgi:precorrin-2/cobalt-factor-2 C20-methyltransferase